MPWQATVTVRPLILYGAANSPESDRMFHRQFSKPARHLGLALLLESALLIRCAGTSGALQAVVPYLRVAYGEH